MLCAVDVSFPVPCTGTPVAAIHAMKSLIIAGYASREKILLFFFSPCISELPQKQLLMKCPCRYLILTSSIPFRLKLTKAISYLPR